MSGQIPAFGNWDYANDLPITQYFESARQAGLVRYSSSSANFNVPPDRDLYALHFNPPSTIKKATRKDKESKESMKMMKQGKVFVCDEIMEKTRPKPVDEDLYKIPPELLRTTKRKKMLGFISNCLLPAACVSSSSC